MRVYNCDGNCAMLAMSFDFSCVVTLIFQLQRMTPGWERDEYVYGFIHSFFVVVLCHRTSHAIHLTNSFLLKLGSECIALDLDRIWKFAVFQIKKLIKPIVVLSRRRMAREVSHSMCECFMRVSNVLAETFSISRLVIAIVDARYCCYSMMFHL